MSHCRREAEEGRIPMFWQSEGQPSSQEKYRSGGLIASEEGGEMTPTGHEEEGEDQGIIHNGFLKANNPE